MVVNGESLLVMEFMVEIMKIISRGIDPKLCFQVSLISVVYCTIPGIVRIYVRGIVQYSL